MLDSKMALDRFNCGNDLVNRFLKEKAYDQQQRKLTKVYVIHRGADVFGFYAIACSSLRLRLPDMTSEFRVPGMLLGMIGVDKRYQGKGISKHLIDHCISLSKSIGKTIACRILYVDALGSMVDYYEKLAFRYISKTGSDRHRLYLDLL